MSIVAVLRQMNQKNFRLKNKKWMSQGRNMVRVKHRNVKNGFVEKKQSTPPTPPKVVSKKLFLPFPSQSYRHVNDNVHNQLYLYYPVDKIVDTPEFQRLRRLKQTGLAHLVYPNTEHSRFTHSLGVYCLALDFIRKLAENQPDLEITSRDKLCVAIAGLCHDLGHGPFSHTYETILSPDAKWHHEIGSTDIFRRIMEKPHVKEVFDKYLDYDVDIDFICEMINPPKEFMKDGKWVLKGRPIEKSYLYGFVSNVHDSFDVDKYDYLLRDSKSAAPISLSDCSITRIRDNMRVGFDMRLGFKRLMYATKVRDELMNVATTRMKLHDSCYQHQKVRACEYMLKEALNCVNHLLKFYGDDGRSYSLKDAYKNLGAFLRTDDSIVSMIRCINPEHPDSKQAMRIMEDIECRRIPPLIGETDIPSDAKLEQFQDYLLKKLEAVVSEEELDQFFVLEKSLHCGLGLNTHPLSKILLYNHKTLAISQLEPIENDLNWQRIWLGASPGVKKMMVFTKYDASSKLKDALYDAIKAYSEEHQSTSPSKRTPTKVLVEQKESSVRRNLMQEEEEEEASASGHPHRDRSPIAPRQNGNGGEELATPRAQRTRRNAPIPKRFQEDGPQALSQKTQRSTIAAGLRVRQKTRARNIPKSNGRASRKKQSASSADSESS
uniref:HD domain-containing protein n=1 Tax=Steinernema glaseri TaxID=37863 RepID=A0A1I8ABY3_9BILA